jgi:transposase, putative, N-terminal domain
MFVSLQFKLELKKEDKEKLVKLMRKQSSAIRMAYNMLKELEEEKTKKTSHTNIPQAKADISWIADQIY